MEGWVKGKIWLIELYGESEQQAFKWTSRVHTIMHLRKTVVNPDLQSEALETSNHPRV